MPEYCIILLNIQIHIERKGAKFRRHAINLHLLIQQVITFCLSPLSRNVLSTGGKATFERT